MSADHPEPAPDPEKPVAGQPEPKAEPLRTETVLHLKTESAQPEARPAMLGPRYVYRFDPPRWTVGFLDTEGTFAPLSVHDTPEAAAIAATRMNGNEPEVDGE